MATKKTEAQIEFKAVTSEFSSGIKDMNSDIKTLSNELKLNATQLKGNADDVNLLKERQSLLQKELQASSQKIELTNNSLIEAERLLGKNSTEYKNLYNQLINAKNQQQAIQNEINDTTNKLKQQDNSLDDAEKAWGKLDKAVDNAGDGFTVAKGVLANLTSSGIQSVVSGVGNLAGSLYETVDATEEYRSMMSKLEGSTKSFGYSTEFSTEKFDTFYKYLGDNQMATNAITNLMGLQTSQESLTALTEASIGIWSAYGDSIPIESLTESINETAQVGKVTGVMADALNWAGISEDEFNKKLENTNSTQERAELIADTLNGVYGESKKTYDELSGSILDANEKENEFQKLQADLGETISPLKDKITELKTQGFEALQPFVEKVVEGFLNFTDWCSENKGTIETIAIIIGSLATAYGLVTTAVGVYNIVMPIYTAITTGASIATTALGGAIAFLTSPITIAIVAIGAIIAIGVLLWKNWDTVKQKCGEIWEGIKTTIGNAIDKVKGFFTGVIDFVKNNWQTILAFLINPFAGAFKLLYEKCDGFRNFVDGFVQKVKDFFVNGFNNMKNGVVNKFTNMKNGVVNTATNLKDGIVNKFNSAKNTVLGIFDKIKNGIKDKIQWAKDKVTGIVDKLKGVFNFNFELPKMKIPHFSIKPAGWKMSDLLEGSIPKLGVEWYAKGAILNKPTAFGINGNNLMVGGEAGAEAVLPISLLESYINNAFIRSAYQSQMYNAEQTDRIVEAVERLENMGFYIDSQRMATATANANDQVNGARINLRSRGVTL